ncbi:MAG TPA: LuxR C-terminal-related transcriptional regulator, partial [Vicinamibacteria bacterium]|nr:LuxR C-terminal-related transcriptional regulator [Vicinamibacteria bacterium]
AADALANLPEDDEIFRADLYQALGDTYRMHGRWAEAKANYLRAMEYVHVPARHLMAAHSYGALADLELRQGRLRAAAGYWETARAEIEERENWGRIPLPVIGWVDLRLGELRYEWNELEAAWALVTRGLERAELGGDARGQLAGYLLASRITLTAGDVEAAAAFLARARPLAERASFPEWSGRFARCQLELWLAQHNLRAAAAWADAAWRDEALSARPEREALRLALARFLIFKGDSASRERALDLLAHLHAAASDEGRVGVQIEALALQALAHWQTGNPPAALVALEEALRLAEPEGYVRLFADLGPPMTRLLHEAWTRSVALEYVAALVAAGGASVSTPAGGASTPLEPLSLREQEVLRLLASGLSNREIAESLFISPETVKKHTGHIYEKLDVGNRLAAVARAQTLGLLG